MLQHMESSVCLNSPNSLLKCGKSHMEAVLQTEQTSVLPSSLIHKDLQINTTPGTGTKSTRGKPERTHVLAVIIK